jgi:hypothetical protein
MDKEEEQEKRGGELWKFFVPLFPLSPNRPKLDPTAE